MARQLKEKLELPITPDKQAELMHLYSKSSFLRACVDNVRTIFQQSERHIYIPDLSIQGQI